MSRTSSTINWKAIFLEAFFVVLGVVLAFAANGYRESQNNERRAETAMTSIMEELSSNHEEIVASIHYHGFLMDTLHKFMRVYGNDPNRYPGSDVFHKGFINPATPLSRAWDVASNTGVIEFIPYEDVLLVSQVYENQDSYDMQSSMVGAEIYSLMFNEGIEAMGRNYRNFTSIVGSFVYRECELANDYARVLPKLRRDSSTVEVPVFCSYMPAR